MALINSLTSGVAALRTFSKGLEVIGDNIANVSTTGFKASRTDYEDSFSDVLQRSTPSAASGAGSNIISMQVGSGVRLADVKAKFTQGALQTTGLPSDLGIAGNGFFVIRDSMSNSQFVTRDGNFRVDDQGYFVTTDGLRVQGLNDGAATFTATVVNGKLTFAKTTSTQPAAVGDLRIDAPLTVGGGNLVNDTGGAFSDAEIEALAPRIESYTVDRAGIVNLFMSNGDNFARGQVLLQQFQDTAALMKEGGNRYSNQAAAGPIGGTMLSAANNGPQTVGLGSIESGTLELSNVDLTQEFSNLITTQRSFQAGSRIITVSDQVLEDVVNLKR